jgi:hypothetical protein
MRERSRPVDPRKQAEQHRTPRPQTMRDLDPAARQLVARHAAVHSAKNGTVSSIASLDGASRARLLGSLQHLYGNSAVQRLVASTSDAAMQRDQVFHDVRSDLTWKDFKGTVKKRAVFDAMTSYGRTGLVMKYTVVKKDRAFAAEAKLDPKSLNLRAFVNRYRSWVRKGRKSAALLRHEQGHFDIADVLVEKAEIKVKAAAVGVIGAGTGTKAKIAIDDALTDLKSTEPFKKIASLDTVLNQAQHDYDEDPTTGTDHGTKPAEQAQWQTDIAAGLPAYPIT